MAKKTFTGVSSVINGVSLEDLEKSIYLAQDQEKKTAPIQRKVGRPTTNTQDITKTTKEGLKEGLDRMTFIVREDFKQKLKFCSYTTGKPIWKLLDEAIEDYLAKYESINGKIEN